MATTEKVLPYYTYADSCRWEDRWELLDGLPFAMSTAPAPIHQKIISKLHYLFHDALTQTNCRNCVVYDFIDVKIREDTIVQPDLLVVCEEIKKKYLDFPPNLVIEVLSQSTALKDKNNKFIIYQCYKIKYYMMIDPDSKSIEIHTLDDEGKYQLMTHSKNGEWFFMLGENCEIRLELNKVWD